MPAAQTQDSRQGTRPHTIVLWAGVALAPLAALIVLFSGGTGMLRVAALLAIVSVALVGLSAVLRPDASSVRAELEEAIFDEIDGLRADVREDITTAARATHKSFSEKLQNLYENVEALRGQVDSARGQLDQVRTAVASGAKQGADTRSRQPAPEPAQSRPVGTAMVGGGVVRHTETVQVTTRQTIVDPRADGDRGRVYGSSPVYGHRAEDRTPTVPRSRRADREERHDRDERRDREERRDRDERQVRPARDEGQERGGRDESWTEQRLRDRLRDTGSHLFGDPGRFGASGAPVSGAAAGSWRRDPGDDRGRGDQVVGRRARGQGRDEPEAGDPNWADLRAGDRWASVRRDEHGRELRMGERRAALHRDETGTELRIEDRWAVRREDDGPPGETRRERREREERWSGAEHGDGWSDSGRFTGGEPEEERWGAAARARHSAPPMSARHSAPPAISARHSAPPALTSTPNEYSPSWPQDWREQTNGGRRERVGDRDERWEREELPRPVSGPRSRRVDFDATDHRWR